jgi:hypothetical protein
VENKQTEKLKEYCDGILDRLPGFYKNFNQPTDQKLFTELLPLLMRDIDHRFLPADFIQLMQKNDDEKLLKKVYLKSLLVNRPELEKLLRSANEKQLRRLGNDPLITMVKSLNFYYDVHIKPKVDSLTIQIDQNMKKYMAGIMEMKNGQALYPDANLTLRVAYGRVEGYHPQDGVTYKHYTTLSGIMGKDNPAVYDYDVPEKLRDLFKTKDFGKYEVDGDVPVCFTASNHTSGGNSGSPVVNARGELIGVNFDRCWEGTMSDILFDANMCRNISLDIRFVLFVIDKFAGAGYLLDEMEIVR